MANIVTHLGQNINWIAYRNGHNQYTITITSSGSAFDISTYVFSVNFRTIGGTTNKLQLTEGSGITNSGATGVLTIDLSEANIVNLPRDTYFYEIVYTKSSKDYPFFQGNITLSSESNPASTSTSVSVSVNLAGSVVSVAVSLAVDDPSDELTAIANLTPENDDIIQRKAGAWINRTIAQLKEDLGINLLVTNLDMFVPTTSRYTWSNQPSAETALLGSGMEGPSTRLFDTTDYSYIKLVAQIFALSGSANTPKIYLKYSEDNVTYTTIGSGTGSDVISLATTGHAETGWIALPFKGNGYWRVVGSGGDGSADPQLGYVSMRFKQ